MILIGAAYAVSLALPHKDRLYKMYRYRMYGPDMPPPPNPLGQEILAKLDEDRKKEVAKAYGKVQVDLRLARMRGFNVDKLEQSLEMAMRLGQNGEYTHALQMIHSVEMRIPKKKETFAPAASDDGFTSQQKDVEGSSIEKPKKAPAKKKRTRRTR